MRSSRDVFEGAPKGGSTEVMFEGNMGALTELLLLAGEHAGNTVESWLYALHMTRVFGRAYQLSALGLVITMLWSPESTFGGRSATPGYEQQRTPSVGGIVRFPPPT